MKKLLTLIIAILLVGNAWAQGAGVDPEPQPPAGFTGTVPSSPTPVGTGGMVKTPYTVYAGGTPTYTYYTITYGTQTVTYGPNGQPTKYVNTETNTQTIAGGPGFQESMDTFNQNAPTSYSTTTSSTKVGETTYTGGTTNTELRWDPATQSYRPTGVIVYKDASGNEIGGVNAEGITYIRRKDGTQDYTTAPYLADAIEEANIRTVAQQKGWPLNADGSVNEDALTDEQEKEYDKIRDEIEEDAEAEARRMERQSRVRSPCQTNAWACMGSLLNTYEQYRGFGDAFAVFIPAYGAYVNRVRSELTSSFCLFAGIANCIESIICGSILDLDQGTILAGRGPGGQLITSGTINAERSLPVDLSGLPPQVLIDMFAANETEIGGRIYNFTDPAFDSKKLRFTLRLYHFRFHLQNNAMEDRALKYNVVFMGERNAKWYNVDQRLEERGDSVIVDRYKFSTYNYDQICLEFDPPLPTSNNIIIRPQFVGHLCRPIVEYQGGATSISAGANTPAPTSGVTEGVGI